MFSLKILILLSMVAHAFNPNSWEQKQACKVQASQGMHKTLAKIEQTKFNSMLSKKSRDDSIKEIQNLNGAPSISS